jgi:hypothetical protein
VTIIRHRRPAERIPHPDPATEARLQRIIALRESAGRKADLSRQYAAEIDKLSYYFRCNAGEPAGDAAEARLVALQGDIRAIEAEIPAVHDEIATRIAELSDTDLAYL